MDKYEEKIKLKWKEERENLKKEIKTNKQLPKWLEIKIKKLANRTFQDEKYIDNIKEWLITSDNDINEILLAFLMKTPKKQNIYQQIFQEKIKNEGFEVKKLNTNRKKSHFIFKDKIMTSSEIISNNLEKPKELKPLNFSINLDNQIIYIVNKYANKNGSYQDNQYNDVIAQLKELGESTVKKVWFCLDGKYYTNQKIDNLKKINNNAMFLTLESLVEKLKTMNN